MVWGENMAWGKATTKLDSFRARAHALARSGHFYGLPPVKFELSFEEGFHEAREGLELASTREELERLCQESRANRIAALTCYLPSRISAKDCH
jgi:hypothetical protein